VPTRYEDDWHWTKRWTTGTNVIPGWWIGGARGQRAHRHHTAAPLVAFEKEFVRQSGSSSRSVGRGWNGMIVPGREDPRSVGQSEWAQKMGQMYCVIRWIMRWNDMGWYEMRYKMRCNIWTPGSPEYIPPCQSVNPYLLWSLYAPVTQSVSIISLSPYTRHSSVLCQAEWRWWWWETDFPATTHPWPLVRSTPHLFRIPVYVNPKEHMTTINPNGRHRHRHWRKNTNVDLKE
jgi:hypothetical protein